MSGRGGIDAGELSLNDLPVGAAVFALDGALVAANDLFRELFGVPAGDGRDLHGRDFGTALDTSWPDVYLDRARVGEVSSQRVSHRFQRLDGDHLVANLRTAPRYGTDGAVMGMTALFAPTAADLPAQYQLLWQSLEEQQELMAEWALDGTILFCNRACREAFGWSDQIIGRNLDEVYDWFGGETRALLVGTVMVGAKTEPQVRTYPDGRVVEWADTAVRDELGNVKSIFSMGRDITARVHAEEQVRINEWKFRAMVRNIRDTVLLISRDGRLIESSSLARPDLGYDDMEDLRGRELRDFVHPDDLERVGEMFRQTLALDAGSTAWAEVRARRADGGWTWLEVSGVNLLHDPGVEAIVLTLRNIDDRKRYEDELAERGRRARQELRQRLELVAQVGHELRNPLQGILAFSDVLAREGLPERAGQAAAGIGRQADTLRRVVEDLLDASRLGLGKLRISRESVDLVPVIEDTVAMAAQLCAEGVIVTAHPIPPARRYVVGDDDRLRQVLTNLLSNACKHTAEGTVEVAVSDGDQAGTVRISVLDTGTGIRAEDVERLFRPFERSHEDERRSVPGIGLGLAIVTGIVSALEGSAGAAPRPEGGAEFWVELHAADGPPPDEPRSSPTAQDDTGALVRRRVLVVDDEPLNLLANRFVLSDLGADVVTAASVPEALEALRSKSFDVVLTDIHLPGADGHTLVRHLRALSSPGPVIAVMSGDASEQARATSLEAGADLFLVKPASPDDLAAVLRHTSA